MIWVKIVTSRDQTRITTSVMEVNFHRETVWIPFVGTKDNYELPVNWRFHGVGKGEAIPLVLKPERHLSCVSIRPLMFSFPSHNWHALGILRSFMLRWTSCWFNVAVYRVFMILKFWNFLGLHIDRCLWILRKYRLMHVSVNRHLCCKT